MGRDRVWRKLQLVAVFLVIGVAITLLVTWGTCWVPPTWEGPDRVRTGGKTYGEVSEKIPWSVPVPSNWPPFAQSFEEHWQLLSEWRTADYPNLNTLELRQGIPFRSMRDWWRIEGPARELVGCWQVKLPGFGERTLPLIPIWPGFALNTLFYAALAWGLWQIPPHLRRRHRRIHNRCLRCGYSRAGLGEGAACPECGTAAK